MKLTITSAENGFVVDVEEQQDVHFYFVALDVNDVCSIVEGVLIDPADQLDITNVAFEAVPRDK